LKFTNVKALKSTAFCCRAAKHVRIPKLIAFCSAAQRKYLNLPTKASQINCILLPRSENFCNLPTKAIQLIAFCSAELCTLPTKATQINCVLFCNAAKNFAICQQKQLKWWPQRNGSN
jgi:hypothetical protein